MFLIGNIGKKATTATQGVVGVPAVTTRTRSGTRPGTRKSVNAGMTPPAESESQAAAARRATVTVTGPRAVTVASLSLPRSLRGKLGQPQGRPRA